MRDGEFELDLALRNNITTEEHPLGVYHPHEQYHHIKKENIGLIEVMGLAVLPSRLKEEMDLLAGCLIYKAKEAIDQYAVLEKHKEWAYAILEKYPDIYPDNVMSILEEEIGNIFVKVLENAGVFGQDEEGRKAFLRFISLL